MSDIPLVVRLACSQRANGACERCLQVKPLDAHHRKQRSLGGLHTCSNIVLVCRRCHDKIHQAMDGEMYDKGWLLRTWQEPHRATIQMPRGWMRLLDSGDALRIASSDPRVARPSGAP